MQEDRYYYYSTPQPRRPVTKPKVVYVSSGWSYGSLLCWFVIFAFIALAIVLAVTVPSDGYYHVRSQVSPGNAATGRTRAKQCTVDEYYDAELHLCAPLVPEPIPILKQMYDENVPACRSFYQHTCGSWIRNHTNEDRAFTYVYRKNKRQTQELITNPASGPAYRLYRSCLDTLVYGKHTAETVAEHKHAVEHIAERMRTHDDIPVVLARLAAFGYAGPFTLSIENHPTEPRMLPLLQYRDALGTQGNTDASLSKSLTDYVLVEGMREQLHEMYTGNNNETVDVNQLSFVEYVQQMFSGDIHTLQSLKADAFWKQYFLELAGPSLEHDLMLAEDAWIPQQDYQFFQRFLQEYRKIPMVQWQAYVRYCIAYSVQNFMPVLAADSYFRVHDTLTIKERQREHLFDRTADTIGEQHCLALTNVLLPGEVARHYLDAYMPNHARVRAKVTEMVERIRDEYALLIQETPWMSPETKKAAVDKIRAIVVRAVHPNIWETEPFALRIDKTRYVHNLNLIRRYRVQRNLQLWALHAEHDKTAGRGRDAVQRFGSPLTTVNAFYSPVTNTITVFAGIITEPFFSEQYDEVALYATLGMIAGHELSHAMDNSGRLFDAEGSLVDWWRLKDVQAFNTRAQCIVEEYGPPHGCENSNYGQQTLGEDIADITGITLAYRAYFKHQVGLSVSGKATAETSIVDQQRQFFTVFAQMWAESYDQKHLCNRVEDDVHAVAWFRVDKTLRQLSGFRTAFRCGDDSQMVNTKQCHVYGI